MTNNGFKYSFKVTGIERKQVANIISEVIGQEDSYDGAPKFSYRAGGWVIDREGIVTTPETSIGDKEDIRSVFDALKAAGSIVADKGTVSFSLEGHTGNTLRNVVNLIWSKHSLLKKALDWHQDIVPASLVNAINAVPIATLEDFAKVVNDGIDAGKIVGESDLDFDIADRTISYSFSNDSMDFDEVAAFIALCWQINEQAKKQKFTSTKQKEVENDKYAMRCFLLKLGFVGEAFKSERKVLLARLDGNAAFRTEEARLVAEEKRKQRSLDANNLTLEQSKSEETENG